MTTKREIKSNKDLTMVKLSAYTAHREAIPIREAAKKVVARYCYSDVVKERLVEMIAKEVESGGVTW